MPQTQLQAEKASNRHKRNTLTCKHTQLGLAGSPRGVLLRGRSARLGLFRWPPDAEIWRNQKQTLTEKLHILRKERGGIPQALNSTLPPQRLWRSVTPAKLPTASHWRLPSASLSPAFATLKRARKSPFVEAVVSTSARRQEAQEKAKLRHSSCNGPANPRRRDSLSKAPCKRASCESVMLRGPVSAALAAGLAQRM